MNEQTPNAPPAVDMTALVKEVTGQVMASVQQALKPLVELGGQVKELAGNQKVLADTLANQKPATPGLDAAGVEKLVATALETRQAEQAKSALAAQAKAQWLEKNAPKLPATYRKMIPDTTDAGELEKAGKAAAEAYESEFKASGVAAPSAAAAATPGVVPGMAVTTPAAGLSGSSPGVAAFAAGIKLPG